MQIWEFPAQTGCGADGSHDFGQRVKCFSGLKGKDQGRSDLSVVAADIADDALVLGEQKSTADHGRDGPVFQESLIGRGGLDDRLLRVGAAKSGSKWRRASVYRDS